MITLYDAPYSGNAYKCRLLLSLLGLDYEKVTVELKNGDNLREDFLARNPRGQIPVIEDDGAVIWDSQAILVYLARKYTGDDWLPMDPLPLAEVMQWMAVSENELLFGLARARAVINFGRDFDLAACQEYGTRGLEVMDLHLKDRKWLAAGRPTIADVACFPYVALAPEGDVTLEDRANVRDWIRRVQALPGYTPMQGIPDPG